MIKEARRLLYCDGLASSRLLEGGRGGRRKLLSLTDFVHPEHHRKHRPSSCELHVPQSVSVSIFPHAKFTEPQLCVYCVAPAAYVNIQHRLACKGLLRSAP